MSKEPSTLKKTYGDFAPKLVDLTDNLLFGDIWERPELSKRDRSLVTVTALIAMNRTEQLRFHIPNALKNGVTKDEVRGHHPLGVLFGLAQCDGRPPIGEGIVHERRGSQMNGKRHAQ